MNFLVLILANLTFLSLGAWYGIMRERARTKREDATFMKMPARLYYQGLPYKDGILADLVDLRADLPYRLNLNPQDETPCAIVGLKVAGLGQIPYRPDTRESSRVNGENPS